MPGDVSQRHGDLVGSPPLARWAADKLNLFMTVSVWLMPEVYDVSVADAIRLDNTNQSLTFSDYKYRRR